MRRQHGQKLEIIPNTLETCGEVIERSLAVAKYQKLVEPFKIGNVELRNCFVMLPMTIEKVDNYHVTDDLVDFYEQRAKGHAGLIEIGSCYVCDCFGTEPKYHTTTGACGCWDDEFIPGFQRIAEVCHKHGSKVAAQLQLCYEWRASGDDPLLSYAPSKGRALRPVRGHARARVHQRGDRRGRQAVRPGRPPLQGCRHRHHRDPRGHRLHGDALPFQVLQPPYRRVRRDRPRTAPASSARSSTRFTRPAAMTCRFSCASLPTILMPDGNRIADTLELIPIIEAHGVDAWSVQAGFHEAPRPWPTRSCPRASSSTSRSR